MNKTLFGRLVDHADRQGIPIAHPDDGRFIKRQDDDDAAILTSARVAALPVTRQIRLVRIDHKRERYFCIFGLPEPDGKLLGLECVPATPALFTLSVVEAKIHPRKTVTASQIKDALDDAFRVEGGDYAGHDLAQIAPFFPDLVVYRVTTPLEYHDIIERVLGSILVRTSLDGPILLESDTVKKFILVFEAGSPLIPYRNLIQGILSISWDYLFVEIYRCVEQLYSLPRIERLKKEMPCSSSIREMAKLLEDYLSWYPKEEEALQALVRLCTEHTVTVICTGLDGGDGETHDSRSCAAARELYKLRNRIVHYRPAHDNIEKPEADWNIVIRGMLEIIAHLYETKGPSFFGALEITASEASKLTEPA